MRQRSSSFYTVFNIREAMKTTVLRHGYSKDSCDNEQIQYLSTLYSIVLCWPPVSICPRQSQTQSSGGSVSTVSQESLKPSLELASSSLPTISQIPDSSIKFLSSWSIYSVPLFSGPSPEDY